MKIINHSRKFKQFPHNRLDYTVSYTVYVKLHAFFSVASIISPILDN